MKKIVNYALTAAAVILAAACSKEIGGEYPAGTDTLVFTATLEQPTKADLSQYDVIWKAGDQIAVNNGTVWANSAALTDADITDGGRSATFTVNLQETGTYTAVYPASARMRPAEGPDNVSASEHIYLPEIQAIPAGGLVCPEALVQVAKSDSKDKLTFKNVTSLIEFTAPEDGIDHVFIRALDEAGSAIKISGEAALGTEPAFTTGDCNFIRLDGSFSAGSKYIAVVYPQETVKTICFGFSKTGTGSCSAKASRKGTSATGFSLPANGGQRIQSFGTLNWFGGTISNKAELDLWASLADYYTADDTIELIADIDYAGEEWNPVNGNETNGHFGGTFEGNGHSIYNIVINPVEKYCGFFSTIASESPRVRVRNLALGRNPSTGAYDGVSTFTFSADNVDRAGALAGYVSASGAVAVENHIPVTDASTGSDPQVGGLVGRSGDASFYEGCTNYADVTCSSATTNTHYVSGMFGVVADTDCSVDKCINYGKVSRTKATTKGNTFIAGIVGRTGNGSHNIMISGCVNHGWIGTTVNVKAKQLYVGGILAMDNGSDNSEDNVKILGCTNESDAIIEITSLSAASNGTGFGGIVGYAKGKATIFGCTNLGTISKPKNHNGIVSNFGGIIGRANSDDIKIENCTNNGPVISAVQTTNTDATVQFYGGICGDLTLGSITACSNYGPVGTVSSTEDIQERAGGIVGGLGDGTISNCMNYGPVSVSTASTRNAAGGIVGMFYNSAARSTGEGCESSAAVTGLETTSGLVVGFYNNSAESEFGSSTSPVTVSPLASLNGKAANATDLGSMLAGSASGISASGVASSGNTIWAQFQ